MLSGSLLSSYFCSFISPIPTLVARKDVVCIARLCSRLPSVQLCANGRAAREKILSQRREFFTSLDPSAPGQTITTFRRRFVPLHPPRDAFAFSTKASTEQASSNGTEASTARRVGFIGLGAMGLGMAANLVRRGNFHVTVWNRSPEKSEEFIKAFPDGSSIASSPAEVVEQCPITFAMVSDPPACLDLFYRKDGVLQALGPGKSYVDCSTVDPETVQKISVDAIKRGARFLEAPVSGSKKPAEDGTLIFLAGGDESLFKEIQLALDVMGKASFFLGDAGKGAEMKLVVNMVMGSMMSAFAEGMALGSAAGLDQDQILKVLDLGAMSNPMFRAKGPNITLGSYRSAFPLKYQLKDLRLALKLALGVRQPLPVASAVTEQYEDAMEAGLGEEDFSAIYEALKIEVAVAASRPAGWFGN